MFLWKLILVCLTVALVYSMPPRLGFIECTNENDCAQDHCCVIGMHRYSIPSCRPFGQLGDYCVTGEESHNLTLTFPNELSVRVSNVHTLFCPCDVKNRLICRRAQCVRWDDEERINMNKINEV